MTTVKDLINHLKCLNPELEVFIDLPQEEQPTFIELPLELVPETIDEVAHVLIKPIL